VLFVTFLCDAIAGFGQAARAAVMSLLVVALSFSMYHFTATANVTYTWEWLRDAGTKAMVAELGQVIAAERPSGSQVILGVDPVFSPVSIFYAAKSTAATIEVVPSTRASDFLYLEDRDQGEGLNVIRRYPVARSMLVKAGR